MNKRILILATSPRRGGNSDSLAAEFARGAEAAGHTTEIISLSNASIGFCRGCLACQSTGTCVLSDDAGAIVEKMLSADVVAFATPVYFYGMCGQMKTLLDRTNPLFAADYAFRDIYLLATAADGEESAAEGTKNGLQGWLDCFEKTRLAGMIFAGGVTAPGDIRGHAALLAAYEAGKAVS